ncbi:hypothetical protein ACFQE5_16920 [Pseudonocardia hispaniensis]|uniref:Anti-sigma regulatory factor (Ser/Thr protein kinase) n=1 Tax=Pseudonocardia hispaniensis TaxID=904933 RepID=A0ABW1J4X8_9PSEU
MRVFSTPGGGFVMLVSADPTVLTAARSVVLYWLNGLGWPPTRNSEILDRLGDALIEAIRRANSRPGQLRPSSPLQVEICGRVDVQPEGQARITITARPHDPADPHPPAPSWTCRPRSIVATLAHR